MKLFYLLLLCPILTHAQAEKERISEIKSWYENIESRLSNCIKIPVTMFYDADYVSGGTTEMEGYYDTTKNEIIKIVEHSYYDWMEDESSFYFRNGELFFILSNGNEPGEMYTAEELNISEEDLAALGGEAKTLSYYEERYYFSGKECILHLHKEKAFPVDEDPSLKGIEDKKQKLDNSSVPLLNRHGYKMLAQFNRQLPKK